jgi:hypothetical protein
MAQTTVFAKSSREVSVEPQMAWSLLGSAAVWSLLPGCFAFDAAVDDSAPIRCLLQAGEKGVAHGVLTVRTEQPGVATTWGVSGGNAEYTFSAGSHRRGGVLSVAAKFAVDPGTAYYLRKSWDRMLGVWLAGACLVLEGRQPWPVGMPAGVQRACAARPALEATESVSASVLIAAPLDVVWEAVWAPATSSPGFVASGHVPGTPVQQAGEMQYFVSRNGDGRLTLSTLFVREVAYQRGAVTQDVSPPHRELSYLLAAEMDATRLELTTRWADAAMAGEPQVVRSNMTDFVRSSCAGAECALSGWRHCASRPSPMGQVPRPAVLLRSSFASASPRGAQVDEVAADRGVAPHPGLVLRAVVESHRAAGIPAHFEARPQLVLLGGQDVAYQSAGDLAPAGAFG